MDKKQCAQLWNDIERISEDETLSAHFLGSIVYVEKGLYHVTSVPQLLVIDGQQRLTTLSLLLSAFSEVSASKLKLCETITAKKFVIIFSLMLKKRMTLNTSCY